MVIRDAQAIKLGSTDVNKIYYGTGKVYDMNKTALEGYCNQLQTTGKNLFDKTTTNKLNAYINTSKKIISDNTARLAYMTCLPSTTYTVSKTAGTRFRVIATSTVPAANTVGDVYEANDTGTSITITTLANSAYLTVYYWTSDHDTISEQEMIDTVQVELGSSASPYEPYSGGVTVPSPDNPEPIETMTGRQIINGRNLFNPSLATTIQSYIANSDGNLVKDPNPNNKTVVFKVKPNTTYIVSKAKSNRFRMGTNPNEIESGTMYNKVKDDDATTLEISTGTDTYLYVFYWTNTDTLTEETIKNSIQIREKCIVDLKSKNLFDRYSENIFTGYISNEGTLVSNINWRTSDFMPVESNENYTYHGLTNAGEAPYSAYYDENKNFISSFKQATGSNTITIPNNAVYVRLSIYRNNLGTFQLEAGNIATDYEPYYDYELAGIGENKDRIYTKEGKWYKYGAVKKYIGVKLVNFSARRFVLKTRSQLKDMDSSTNVLCSGLRNCFKNNNLRYNYGWNGLAMVISQNDMETIGATTAEEFKTWLDNNLISYAVINTDFDDIDITEITAPGLIAQLNALYQAM